MELQPEHEQDGQQRTFLVLLLLMAMFFIWTTMRPRPQVPPQEEEPVATEEKNGKKQGTDANGAKVAEAPTKAPAKAPAVKAAPPTPPGTSATPEPEVKRITKRSKFFSAVFTNQDAALERLTLLDYFRDPPSKAEARRALKANRDADVAKYGLPLLGQVGTEPSLVVTDRATDGGSADSKLFVSRRYELVSKDRDRDVVFRATFAGGIEVTKTYRLPAPGDELQRHLWLEVQVKNTGSAPVEYPGYRLQGAGGLAVDISPASWKRGKTLPDEAERKAAVRSLEVAVGLHSESAEMNVARRSCSKLQDNALSRSDARIAWTAVQSNYFTVILDPLPAAGQKSWVWSGGASAVGEHNVGSNIETQTHALAPGQSIVHRYRLYAGPKKRSILEAYGADYDKVIEPSKLHYLRVVLYAILRGAYAIIPNWGVAIILLTIVVRVALHPLSRKSQISMARMQKLQPQTKELREKYKKDKRRQQEEMMKLYKEYGVNPLGGCLPMILQIPVFIGLWGVLRGSIELRQAPFVLWIRDLSQPDAFMGAVNILPILCIVVMFIQQRMMPKSPDPQQQQTQKIMGYMMPALLGVMFYGLASGVALYFSASMFLGIVEQKRIRQHLDKMGDLKPVKRKKPDKQGRKAISARPSRPARKRKPF